MCADAIGCRPHPASAHTPDRDSFLFISAVVHEAARAAGVAAEQYSNYCQLHEDDRAGHSPPVRPRLIGVFSAN